MKLWRARPATPAQGSRRALTGPDRKKAVEEAIPVPVEIAGQWGWRVLVIVGVIEAQFVPANALERVQKAFSQQRALVQAGLLGVVLLAITTLGPTGVAPFIYYRF